MEPDGPALRGVQGDLRCDGWAASGATPHALGGEAWTALKRENLACAVAAHRARQARVLPRSAAAEDAARLAEVMSFALAACVVAERFASVAGRPAALGWLGQEPAALRALAAYFGDGPSELRAIACEAERRIGLTLDRGPAASAAPPEEEATADVLDTPQPETATVAPEPASERTPPPAIGGEGAGWKWINWVRVGLRKAPSRSMSHRGAHVVDRNPEPTEVLAAAKKTKGDIASRVDPQNGLSYPEERWFQHRTKRD